MPEAARARVRRRRDRYTQNRETMSIESARAFLRGLPTEQTEELTPVTTNTDRRAAVLPKLRSTASLQCLAGYGQGRKGGCTVAAHERRGVEAEAAFEISLTPCSAAQRPVSASEQKLLKYALEVQDVRLSNTFATLGVNTPRFCRALNHPPTPRATHYDRQHRNRETVPPHQDARGEVSELTLKADCAKLLQPRGALQGKVLTDDKGESLVDFDFNNSVLPNSSQT